MAIQLIYKGQILVAKPNLYLINPYFIDVLHISVGKAVRNNKLNCSIYAVPTGLEYLGGLFPGQAFGPAGKEHLVCGGHMLLAFSPGNTLNVNAVNRTRNTSRRIPKKCLESP